MDNGFEEKASGIYEMRLPFEDLTTSAFLLAEGSDTALLDSGANESDGNAIAKAASNMGASPKYILCSHLHGDHAGGLSALVKAFPKAEACFFDKTVWDGKNNVRRLTDGEILFGRFEVVNLAGHTDDCLAVFDEKTGTLLSVDCLQCRGVSGYGANITDISAYFDSINRIRNMNVSQIVTSHDYVPYGKTAVGKNQIEALLEDCETFIAEIISEAERVKFDLSDEFCCDFARRISKKGMPPVTRATVKSAIEFLIARTKTDYASRNRTREI